MACALKSLNFSNFSGYPLRTTPCSLVPKQNSLRVFGVFLRSILTFWQQPKTNGKLPKPKMHQNEKSFFYCFVYFFAALRDRRETWACKNGARDGSNSSAKLKRV